MKLALLTIAMLAVVPRLALAQGAGQPTTDTLNAATLYTACTHPVKETPQEHEFAEQTCAAFLRGVTDGLFIMQVLDRKHERTCMPEDSPISVSDARRIFQTWLQNRPETATNSAGVVSGIAIVRAYGCAKSK